MENRDSTGKFSKGHKQWLGKKRSIEDRQKMSKQKSVKYIDKGITGLCKFCNKEFIKSIHNQIYCKVCAPTNKFVGLIRKYNISHTEYLEMLSVNDGNCDICLIEVATDIDHDHSTGKVRGMLCHNCNMILGHAKDNVNILNGSIEYLTRSNYK